MSRRHTIIVIAEDRVIVERFRGAEGEASGRAQRLAEEHAADVSWHLIDGWVEIELDSEVIADAEPEHIPGQSVVGSLAAPDDGCPANDPDCMGGAGDQHLACERPSEGSP